MIAATTCRTTMCVCDRVERIQSWQRSRQERTKRPNGAGTWRKRNGWNRRVAKERIWRKEGRQERLQGRNSDRYGDRDTGSNGNTGESKRQRQERNSMLLGLQRAGHIGVNCSHKWTNCIDEEDDQSTSRQSELEGRSQNTLRVWRRLTMRENGVGPNGTESPGGENEKCQHSTTLQKATEKSRLLDH